jgi:hypothetical protein
VTDQISQSGELLPADDRRDNLVVLKNVRGVELSSIAQCRREVSRLYRLARRGKIKSDEASRLVYVLDKCASLIERGELEQRVRDLETAAQLRTSLPRMDK